MRFSEIAAVYLHAFNKMLVSGTHTQWKLVDLQPDLFTVVFDSVVHELKHNKMVMFAQYIDSAISGRYTVPAPYKAGAGRGNPKFNIEHNRAHAVFSCHEHCYAQIMVGRAGPTSVGPGSMLTGISTPVRLTTYMVVESLGGEFFEFNIGAVTMTTTTTHPFLKIEIINGKAVTTSLFEYLKLLRLAGVPGYISRVVVNPATGLRIPKYPPRLTRHKRVFLSAHVYSMAAQVGASSEAPVLPWVSGNANPAWAATNHGFASVGGSCNKRTQGAVTMTTTTTHPFLKIEIINGKAVIFSLHVACHFKRMHQNIVDKIEYLNCSREFFTRNFIPGTYHIYGDSLRGYYITLDGLMMLQLGLSLRTMRYYESCIEAFHEAETVQVHSAFRRHQREVHL
ncbi:ash family protein [Escherichia coli]|uniref:ash family protein n=1 Tax=Escherichia coli TaxID=562 RepID=UPI003B512F9E